MKMYLDKDYLQKITNGNHELLISEEQKLAMERISGMITQDIRFCCLMTGYRGTGKSCFIKYLLDKIQEKNSSVSVVSFNAAKYQNYETFVRRFIRELFFQMDKKNLASNQLRKMYYRTFFDVKETYLNQLHDIEVENIEREKMEQIQYKKNINITKILSVCFRLGLYLLSLIVICCGMDLSEYKLIYSLIVVITAVIIEVLDINYNKESMMKDRHVKNSEEKNLNENRKLVETLYDSEIAEYYVYDELKKIDEGHNTLIFVLDELDKIEDKELDMIFRDLKPLFLSDNCNFILIAGRNMEKYLCSSQKDTDSIVSNIFSQIIYMPLSSIQDMRDFAECFYKAETVDRGREFYLNSDVQNYFNLKIYEAKGVKRAFINGILSDLRWEGDKPYIDLSSKNISEESTDLFTVLERMEENIYQNFLGRQRDELLQILYYWLKQIEGRKHTTFTEADIWSENEQITESFVYTNVAERTNLLQNLLDYMTEVEILEELAGHFKWRTDITINKDRPQYEVKNDIINAPNIIENYVELFQEQWDEIGIILACFATYTGLLHDPLELKINQANMYRFLLGEMISDFGNIYSELEESLLYLQQLHERGIKENDMRCIQNYSRKMVSIKIVLLERLFSYSYKKKKGLVNIQTDGSDLPFDIIYYEEMTGETIFIEIKYYKEYLKIVNHSLLYKLLGQISNYMNKKDLKKYMLKLVIFTDSVDEEGMDRFRQKCNRMLEEFYEKDNIQITLVPFNDYKTFRKQLDACFF